MQDASVGDQREIDPPERIKPTSFTKKRANCNKDLVFKKS